MNYIALYLASYLYTYPLAATNSKIPQTEKVAEAVRLANLVPGTRVHIGIIIALLVAALIWYVLYKTSYGVKFRAVGINPVAADCNGIPVKKYLILSIAISGATANSKVWKLAAVWQVPLNFSVPSSEYRAVSVQTMVLTELP